MAALRWIDKYYERYIMAIMLAAVVIFMFWDVIGRYVMGQSPLFAQEIARYAMITCVFFGLPYGIRYNGHIKADILPELIPKAKPFFDVASDVGMFFFGCLMIPAGFTKIAASYASGQMSVATNIPIYVMYIILEIGWILCLVRIIQKYILKIVFKKGFSYNPEDLKRNIDVD